MVTVRTQFTEHSRVFAPAGTSVRVLYAPRYTDDGVLELVESGRENLYDYIQSHRDSVDIHVILDRYRRGDISALGRTQGVYGDFTAMPRTYAEALNAMISAENYFNGLPVEVRARFDHSFQRFLASMDKPGFAEAMQFTAPDVSVPAADPAPAPAPAA